MRRREFLGKTLIGMQVWRLVVPPCSHHPAKEQTIKLFWPSSVQAEEVFPQLSVVAGQIKCNN